MTTTLTSTGAITAASYDGIWLGTTDQGQVIGFQIENNGIRAVSAGFVIPGCERDSPISGNFGTPEYFITNDSFELTLKSLYTLNVQGTFTSTSSISGTLEILPSNPCNQGLTAQWSAVPAEDFELPPLPPELTARIPTLDIPDELLLPEVGAQNFDQFTHVLGQQDDWFLVTTFDSIYPLPAGWTTLSTGKEDAILVFRKGGIQIQEDSGSDIVFDQEADIIITVGGSAGQYQTADEIIAELEGAFQQQPNLSIIEQQVVDPKKAYIFLELNPESDDPAYRFILFSQQPSDGWFRTLSVITDVQDWDEYYPIIRAIAENWALSWDNSTLGVTLPDTLVE
jgi:hypothetical protein